MRNLIIIALLSIFTIGCTKNKENMKKPYVIEITTFKYKPGIDANAFWKEDAVIEANYTSQQPGYISRESGYAESKEEVVVVVRWETQADADASMAKFMGEESVMPYANMIDGPSMKMQSYDVK